MSTTIDTTNEVETSYSPTSPKYSPESPSEAKSWTPPGTPTPPGATLHSNGSKVRGGQYSLNDWAPDGVADFEAAVAESLKITQPPATQSTVVDQKHTTYSAPAPAQFKFAIGTTGAPSKGALPSTKTPVAPATAAPQERKDRRAGEGGRVQKNVLAPSKGPLRRWTGKEDNRPTDTKPSSARSVGDRKYGDTTDRRGQTAPAGESTAPGGSTAVVLTYEEQRRKAQAEAEAAGLSFHVSSFYLSKEDHAKLQGMFPDLHVWSPPGAQRHGHPCLAFERAYVEALIVRALLKHTQWRATTQTAKGTGPTIIDIGANAERHSKRRRETQVYASCPLLTSSDAIRAVKRDTGNMQVSDVPAPACPYIKMAKAAMAVHVYELTPECVAQTLMNLDAERPYMLWALHTYGFTRGKTSGSMYGEATWRMFSKGLEMIVEGGSDYSHSYPHWVLAAQSRIVEVAVDGKSMNVQLAWSVYQTHGHTTIFQFTVNRGAQLAPSRSAQTIRQFVENSADYDEVQLGSGTGQVLTIGTETLRVSRIQRLGEFVCGFTDRKVEYFIPLRIQQKLNAKAANRPRTPDLIVTLSTAARSMCEHYKVPEDMHADIVRYGVATAMHSGIPEEVAIWTQFAKRRRDIHAAALHLRELPHGLWTALTMLVLALFMLVALAIVRGFAAEIWAVIGTVGRLMNFTIKVGAASLAAPLAQQEWWEIAILAFAEEVVKRTRLGPFFMRFELGLYVAGAATNSWAAAAATLVVRCMVYHLHVQWSHRTVFNATVQHTVYNIMVKRCGDDVASQVILAYACCVVYNVFKVKAVVITTAGPAPDEGEGPVHRIAYEEVIAVPEPKPVNPWVFYKHVDDDRTPRLGVVVRQLFSVPVRPVVHAAVAENFQPSMQFRAQLDFLEHPSVEADFRRFVQENIDDLLPGWREPLDLERWNAWLVTQPAKNRSRLAVARESLREEQISNRDLSISAMIKRELVRTWTRLGNQPKNPRNIGIRKDRFKAAMGRACSAMSRKLKSILHEGNYMVYAVGYTAEGLGRVFDRMKDVAEGTYIECDCSNWDSSMGYEKIVTECWLMGLLGMDDVVVDGYHTASDLMWASINKSGRTRGGIRFSIHGTRTSGDYWTTCASTLRNLLSAVYSLCRATGLRPHDLRAANDAGNPCYIAMAGGDDILEVVQPQRKWSTPKTPGSHYNAHLKRTMSNDWHFAATDGYFARVLKLAMCAPGLASITVHKRHLTGALWGDWPPLATTSNVEGAEHKDGDGWGDGAGVDTLCKDAWMRAQGFWPKTKSTRDWRLVTFYSAVPWQSGGRTVWGPKIFRSLVTAGHSMDQPMEGRTAKDWRASVSSMGLYNCNHVPVLRKVWLKCRQLEPSPPRRLMARDKEDAYRTRVEQMHDYDPENEDVFVARYGHSPASLESRVMAMTSLPFHLAGADVEAMLEIDL